MTQACRGAIAAVTVLGFMVVPAHAKQHRSPILFDRGSTFFELDRDPTAPELLAVSAGGMEADAVAARLVAERAFNRGRMRPRDAMRYLGFELDKLGYVSSTGDVLDDERAGHDVAQFLRTYNAMAIALGAPAVSARTLRREALVSLANPMIAFAAYGIGRFVWSGAMDVGVPAASIGGVRWLPLVRYQLAPYGTEAAVTNHLAGSRWPTRIEVRVGRGPGARPWGYVRGMSALLFGGNLNKSWLKRRSA